MSFLERFLLAERSAPHRYGAAVALACVFLALVYLLSRVEGTGLSSLAVVSVVLSAIYGGLGPALLAAALCAIGVDYFVTEPGGLFDSWTSLLRVITYAAIGAIIAGIVGALRSAYRELHAQYRQTEQARRARENIDRKSVV